MAPNKKICKTEKKLIHLFGEENTKKDLILGRRYAELFGDLSNHNRNIIRDIQMKKKLIFLFGVVKKPVKVIKIKKKNSKKLQARIKKRIEYLFGKEDTKKDKIIAKKILHLFGEE